MEREPTHERLIPDIARSIKVEHNSQIVGIIRGVKLGDIKQALSAEAVAEVAGIEGRIPIHR